MKLLLDTQILLWAGGFGEKAGVRLPSAAAELISDRDNGLHFSVVSIWEAAIKAQSRPKDFELDVPAFRRSLLAVGYTETRIEGPHAEAVLRLPLIHRDPFDRMLVSQATVEGMLLVTTDRVLSRYPGPIQLV